MSLSFKAQAQYFRGVFWGLIGARENVDSGTVILPWKQSATRLNYLQLPTSMSLPTYELCYLDNLEFPGL